MSKKKFKKSQKRTVFPVIFYYIPKQFDIMVQIEEFEVHIFFLLMSIQKTLCSPVQLQSQFYDQNIYNSKILFVPNNNHQLISNIFQVSHDFLHIEYKQLCFYMSKFRTSRFISSIASISKFKITKFETRFCVIESLAFIEINKSINKINALNSFISLNTSYLSFKIEHN
ncbi:hypothetical protein BpHYR1_014371 [Brachionus plicatilis]|uniref:Uncharacterized protein n=1 Tax=Brachionus plicatilis TaxID=10195 RepID=A0A3M7RLW3_BRAPC|nr:hypothetical protein BpHYR1_014371 [Brachionus plicatilis]